MHRAPRSSTTEICAQRTNLVQLDSCACVLNGVVGVLLNVLTKQVARQKAQTQLALPLEVEQEDGVNHLYHQWQYKLRLRTCHAVAASKTLRVGQCDSSNTVVVCASQTAREPSHLNDNDCCIVKGLQTHRQHDSGSERQESLQQRISDSQWQWFVTVGSLGPHCHCHVMSMRLKAFTMQQSLSLRCGSHSQAQMLIGC